MPSTILLIVLGVPALIIFFIVFSFFSTWLKAKLNGAPVGFANLLGMRLGGVPYNLVVDARITAVKAGIEVTTDKISAHYLAGGNVVPTVQARGATYAIGTPGHSWQLTAQVKMAAAHKGLVHVAKVMAGTALDAIQDAELVAQAKADHQAKLGRTPYVCPIPNDVEPPVRMSV